MTTLESIVRADLISLNLKAETKKLAIEELADTLYFKDAVSDRTEFAKSVLAEELETSDNKGNGIAFALGRSASVSKTVLGVGRLEHGISWDDAGEAVDIIFVLATPPDDIDVDRLNVTGALDEILNKITLVSDLYNLDSPDELAESIINHIDEI